MFRIYYVNHQRWDTNFFFDFKEAFEYIRRIGMEAVIYKSDKAFLAWSPLYGMSSF